jgi:hypothetical protein
VWCGVAGPVIGAETLTGLLLTPPRYLDFPHTNPYESWGCCFPVFNAVLDRVPGVHNTSAAAAAGGSVTYG